MGDGLHKDEDLRARWARYWLARYEDAKAQLDKEQAARIAASRAIDPR